MLKKRLNRLSLFYPLLFTLYVCSITLFTHSHYINNIRYVHSHPIRLGEIPSHDHSEKELQLLDQLFNTSITSDIIPDVDLSGNIPLKKIRYSNLYQHLHIISPTTPASAPIIGRESMRICEYEPSIPFILTCVVPQFWQLFSTLNPG